jgi:hypothetical protein
MPFISLPWAERVPPLILRRTAMAAKVGVAA